MTCYHERHNVFLSHFTDIYHTTLPNPLYNLVLSFDPGNPTVSYGNNNPLEDTYHISPLELYTLVLNTSLR